jgi:2-haloacid dehalogenase
MRYELLLFDADDTLFDFAKCEENALELTFIHHGHVYNKENHDLYKKVNQALWKEYEQKLVDKETLKTERFRRLFKELKNEVDYEEVSRTYLDFLSQQACLIDGAEELLDSIHGKYKIAIITNGIKEVQLRRIQNSTIKQYIDGIIISEEVGYPKPYTEIFDYSFEVMKHTNKESAIIIGDNIGSDILGGNRFGIDSCLYNPNNVVNVSEVKPTYEIKELSQLLEILK